MFKGAIATGTNHISDDIKLRAAENLARVVSNPIPSKVIPTVFEKGVVEAIVSSFSA